MKTLFALAFAFVTSVSHAQLEVPAEDAAAAQALLQAVKAGDKQAVAALVAYPIGRRRPLSSLKNAQEFVEDYDHFFDDKTTLLLEEELQNLWWSWRGTGTATGMVWFMDGKIYSINLETDKQSADAAELKKRLQAKVHPIAREYDEKPVDCETAGHRVRVQTLGNKTQYFSWKRGTALSEKPALALLDGTWERQDSGGGMHYIFKNGRYTYVLEMIGVCGEDCNDYLVVMRGSKEISRSVCTPVPEQVTGFPR